MQKRLPYRRSAASHYSRLSAVIAIPVIVLGVLLHRSGLIETPALFMVLGLAFALALVAIVAGALALASIWRAGGYGTGDAVLGLVLGLIAFSPAIAGAAAAVWYPRLNDVSTDVDDPPPLRRGAILTGFMTTTEGPVDYSLQRRAYPDIVPRRFPIGTVELDTAVRQVLTARGWTIRQELRPAMSGDSSEIIVEARSPVVGFTDDFAIRIRPDVIGSRLDLHSASRYGIHDLGANARRIRSFLESLDKVLTEAYGTLEPPEADAAPLEPEASEDAEPPTPFSKPSPADRAPKGPALSAPGEADPLLEGDDTPNG